VVTRDDRRQFLKFLGAGLTGAYAGGLGPLAAAGPPPELLQFGPIRPTSSRDDLVLPDGFGYDILARWGDRLPGTSDRFGYNADFTFGPLPWSTARHQLAWRPRQPAAAHRSRLNPLAAGASSMLALHRSCNGLLWFPACGGFSSTGSPLCVSP
jgi:hypothetical protein